MKKLFALAIAFCALWAIADNSIRDGGEYILYNIYYARALGGNASDSGPALSAYATNGADDYVFVAEASSLHEGYYWLRHKKTGKYLQASNAENDTWSVWFAGSLNKAYNSYEWGLTPGIDGEIRSNRGETIHSATKCLLAPDPNHEADKYVNVYYDKTANALSVWQIVDAADGLDAGRMALYVDVLNEAIAQGQAILDNPAYGTADDQYALAAALYNARNAVQAASADDLDALATALDALNAAIENAQQGNYAIWVSGSSFATGDAFTVALKGVKFADTEGAYCTMAIRGSQKTGATVTLDASGVKIGEKEFAFSSGANAHDIQLAFDGQAVVVYLDGQQAGHAPQGEVPTMSACGQAAEWTVFGVKAMESYRPEIVSSTKDMAPGQANYNDHGKVETWAIKLVGQDITLSGSVDYHICADSAIVNSKINITDPNAWLILDNVRPSDAIAYYMPSISIAGAPAELGLDTVAPADPNCRFGIYLQGTVVIPHDDSYQAFTGYTEPQFAGEEIALPLGDNHELGANANMMRSFKLKRGYMATLATNADGSGYSRVYVADHEDKLIGDMPELLDKRVSFVFVRKWNYVSKKGWCGTGKDYELAEQGKLLGSTWFYSWSADRESQVDMEFVPMQCHRYWPSIQDFYPKYNSTAMLGLNEPEHSEQHTSDRCSCGGTTDAWTACTMNPNYFHTGLRIGGPSPTEASWIQEYVGHCNDMAYRCDFIGYHAYWGTNEAANSDVWWSRLLSIYNNTKRPIWLTEWNNGASWTKESWPTDWNDQLDYQRRKIIEICSTLDNAPFIERYTIFNLNDDKRRVLKWDSEAGAWWVTPAGEAYRELRPSHAYREDMQFVPNGWFPGLKEDVGLAATFDEASRTFRPVITNPNGDNSAVEAIEYLSDDNGYVTLWQTPRGDLDVTGSRSQSISVDQLPAEALANSKLVIRLRVTTHKGGVATSKRVVIDVPESLRGAGSGVESVTIEPGMRFFTLQGIEVRTPEPGRLYIVASGERVFKAILAE